MRWLAMLFCVAMLMAVVDARTMGRDPFEGTWKARVEPDADASKAGERAFEDTFTFKGIHFESKHLKEKGFAGVATDQDTRGITTGKFTAEQKHPTDKDQTANWEGSVTSTEMKGTLVWTKKGTKRSFNFSASKN